MSGNCTCGSPVPVGASFCPNCGRPLRPGAGEPAEPPEPPPSEPALEASVEPADGQHRAAVQAAYFRAAFPAALGATFVRFGLGVLGPAIATLSFAAIPAAGYVTVRLFEKAQRRNTVGWEGLVLGLLAGLLCFLPSLVLQLLALATQGREAILAPIRAQAEQFPLAVDMAAMLEDPVVFAVTVGVGLTAELLLLLLFSGIGGAFAGRASRSRP